MNQFHRSCSDHILFPKNLINSDLYDHSLHSYSKRLDKYEESLFSKEADTLVDFWQFKDQSSDGSQLVKIFSISVID